MYIAPRLSEIHFGPAVLFNPEAPNDEERARICDALKESITEMAVSLERSDTVSFLSVSAFQLILLSVSGFVKERPTISPRRTGTAGGFPGRTGTAYSFTVVKMIQNRYNRRRISCFG